MVKIYWNIWFLIILHSFYIINEKSYRGKDNSIINYIGDILYIINTILEIYIKNK